MSDVTITAQEAGRWVLSQAILVYEALNRQSVYATVHKVEGNAKGFRLAYGVPATKEACAQLARSLGAAATLSGFTPANLLYLGARTVMWWRPAAPTRVFFDTTKSAAGDQREDKSHASVIGKRNGITPQPGLVFSVTSSAWYVHALRGTARPEPDTALLRAPYFNVWKSGQVCTGNVRLPETLSTAALDRYERAFFDSEFTHPNVHGAERLTRHPKGSYRLWAELLAGEHAEFPAGQLVDAKLTLKDLAAQLEKAER
jgi:PRTRC genetic system protein B